MSRATAAATRIILLTVLLVPELPLALLAGLFSAGSLFMYIDDHGDCFTDRRDGRVTYMNQMRDPERTLHCIVTGPFPIRACPPAQQPRPR